MNNTSKVIAICGSTKYKSEIQDVQNKLVLEGNIVVSISLLSYSEAWENQEENKKAKKRLVDINKRKINMADEVFVVDVDGYIEESIKSEIIYAQKQDKPVRYYSKEIVSEKGGFSFQKLTPTMYADLTTYEEALNVIFDEKNRDIQNIAITGIYGSGKSSIINSYEQKYNKKFIHISLAHFDGVEEDDGDILEKKIINQLIQQIPEKIIPETRFKTKKEFCWWRTLLHTFEIVLLLLLSFYISKYNDLSDEISAGKYLEFKKIVTGSWLIGAVIVFSLLLIVLLFQLIKWQKQNHIIGKIAINGNEVEFTDDKEDKSYFNRHIDEILYVLEKITTTKEKDRFDGIIVEDLDRFDKKIDSKIFEKLREICVLANKRIEKNSEQIPPTMRFFYLLSDDTFLSKERTKFFDYIIPIIPVVDSSNSYAKIKEELKKAGFDGKIDDHFLRGLSLYFDDYRMIKNIINEFQVYAKKLSNIEHNYNELLAVIVYKNYFPKDFAKLQLHSGYVNCVFDKRTRIIEKEKESLNASLAYAKERLKYINNEMLSNERELQVIKSDRMQQPSFYKDISYNIWDKEVYPKRYQAIKDKIAHKEREIREEIVRIQTELIHVNNKKLNKLITAQNESEVFDVLCMSKIDKPDSFKSDDDIDILSVQTDKYFGIIKYLIMSGYLDDTSYRDYMACFDENGMSISDKNFLICVRSGGRKNYDYELNNLALVYEGLKDDDFLMPATKNYMLLDYVIRNNKTRSFESFVLQLKESKDLEFIAQYLRKTTLFKEFVFETCKLWDDFLEIIISDENQSMLLDERQNIVLTALCVCSEDVIKRQNNTRVLKNYLENDISDAMCEDDMARIIAEKLEIFDIDIHNLDSQIASKKLREEIIHKSLYELNLENLQSILRKELTCDADLAEERFLTSLIEGADSYVSEYISENLESVVSIVVENFKSQADNQKMIEMVTSSEIDDTVIVEYLNLSDTVVDDISKINPKYWGLLAEKHTINESIENIILYFDKYKIDMPLVKFLNSANIAENIDFSSDIDSSNKMWPEVYKNNDLSDRVYIYLVEQIGREISNFNDSGIEESKCRILIKHNLIPVNQYTINFMRIHYKSLMHDFICADVTKYISNVRGGLYSLEEVKDILEERSIAEEDKVKLLNMTKDIISVANMKLSDIVFRNILENHFDVNDLQYLAEKYDTYNEECKSVIDKIMIAHKTKLSNIASDASISILTKLFSEQNLSLSEKADILNILIKGQKPNGVIAKLLNLAGEDMLARLFSQERSRMSSISNDAGHKRLLSVLKDNKIIEDFSEDEERKFLKIKR